MNAQREVGGSVLGKRSHQIAHVETLDADVVCELQDTQALPTPDSTPNPKRAKTTTTVLDGDHNKENIPPFVLRPINGSPSSRVTRSLRRTSTMVAGGGPMRSPSTPRRYASASDLRTAAVVADTPASSFAQLSLTTPPPTPPTSLLPIHVRARALLRPTCNDTPQFAGRSFERQRIESFLIGFLASRVDPDAPSTLYVSGSPGTGKTALVNAVLASLDMKLQAQGTRVLSINCMALDGVDAVWQRLAETLGSPAKATGRTKRAKASPKQTIENALSASERKCVIVLDELDHIASSSQALTPLFNLASTYSSCLRLIGIANTHTLTSSSCTTFSVRSMIGVDTLHFSPYTPEQLLEILQTRLAPLSQGEDSSCVERAKKFLPLPTLTLLSKKIAAQTGDVRAVFEVLRGAIDIAVTAATSPDPLNVPTPSVTPSHILSALKAYAPAGKTTPAPAPSSAATIARKVSDSETVTKVRELGLQQRLVLLSMLLAVKSADAGVPLTGSSPNPSPPRTPVKRSQSSAAVQASTPKQTGFELGQLHSYYAALLSRAENGVFTAVSRSEFGDLAGVLEVVGLLALSSSGSTPSTPRKGGKKAFGRTASFANGLQNTQEASFVDGVRLDEVARGLGLGVEDAPADIREEEVRAIYQREQARIAREAKARGQTARVAVAGFEDAEED
ncbi:P-loop containing nucleoside triphosphate hydrolase protein [Trametes coccinea BRFM310]|uniref:p-loop containing nucleoside triphosphate hydrolase protein n=1 Tax=Trametes coccinea (strain BRFM310) TaxID=1353009 RepID=A0A1Y2ISA1_TRAC3|nr:P-loop containing nucleoside triphosphate hydrolase protein [Trametes coccinea BRFM310]